MRIWIVCLYLLSVPHLYAQQLIETPDQITAFAVSKNEKFLAFATPKMLYWADIEQFKLLDSFPIPVTKDNYIRQIKILSHNNGLILKQSPFRSTRFRKTPFIYFLCLRDVIFKLSRGIYMWISLTRTD
jgi:hypothetical protein